MNYTFNVLKYDFNKQNVGNYNIMPYFIECYNKTKNKPHTFDEFKIFILHNSIRQFHSRCEYEIFFHPVFSNCPIQKIDVYEQIIANIDVITQLFMKQYDR